MDRALDNFGVGKQREVNASDVKSGNTIRAAGKRFQCPVCGEYVTFIPKTIGPKRTVKSHFSHLSAESDVTCDLRISSNASLSFYERVGQYLYLIPKNNNRFSLEIGFGGIGKACIQKYEEEHASIIIKTDKGEDRYKIDRRTFYYDETTMLPIHHSSDGNNYIIDIDKGSLHSKWSNFCEGLSIHGGIFEFGINGGKKIRKANTIAAGQKYYLVIPERITSKVPMELNYCSEGLLLLSNKRFEVGTIVFNGKKTDYAYKKANAFLINYYGIQLSEVEPQLIPLWPPAVEKYDMITFEPCSTSRALLYVQSSDDNPSIYQYYGSSYKEIEANNHGVVNLPVTENELPVSIDRHFFGKTYFIKKSSFERKQIAINLQVHDINGKEIELIPYTSLPPSKCLVIQASFPVTIYKFSSSGNRRIQIETEQPVQIDDIGWNDSFVFFSDLFLGCLSFPDGKPHQEQQQSSDSHGEVLSISINDNSPRVPIERWILEIINSDRLDNRTKQKLIKYVRQGYIPINVKKQLYCFYKGEK